MKSRVRHGCEVCGNIRVMCESCAAKANGLVRYAGANLPDSKVHFVVNAEEPGFDPHVWEYNFATDGLDKSPFRLYGDVVAGMINDPAKSASAGRSVLLSGNNGTGKTTAATTIAIKFLNLKLSVFYCTFPELHRFHTLSFHDELYGQLLQECLMVDLLIVDELGKETSVTGSVEYLADTYLKHREERFLSTILITNLSFNVLRGTQSEAGRYGRSFWAMLRERYRLFAAHPKAKDMRIPSRKDWDSGHSTS